MAEGYSVDNGFQQADGKNNEPIVGGLLCNEIAGVIRLTLNAVDTAGGVFSTENTTQNTYLVDLSYVNVTTAATGAATLDMGIGATATTSDDTLIDGVDVGSAAIIANNIDNEGTNGGIGILWAPGEFVTGSIASGASSGIVGDALIRYVRV